LNYIGAPWVVNKSGQQLLQLQKRCEIKPIHVGIINSPNQSAWYGACLFSCSKSVPRSGRSISQKDGAMRFHKDRDNRLHPMRPSHVAAPPPRNAKFGMRRPGTLAPRPIKRQSLGAELLSQEDGIAIDSPMITACYEAHLSMKKMLAAFAELRGDDAEDAIG
jgi:hypothetical protein